MNFLPTFFPKFETNPSGTTSSLVRHCSLVRSLIKKFPGLEVALFVGYICLCLLGVEKKEENKQRRKKYCYYHFIR